jgi:zinc transport system substrate-binding protein
MIRNLIIFVVLLVPGLGNAEPLRVFVSVPPLKTFVEKIGGDHVDVGVMVRPDYNPATYDPTPRQIGALAKTDLYISTGVPFEKGWMERIRSANPDMQMIDARAGIDLRMIENHEEGNQDKKSHHGKSGYDSHVWTSPPLAKQMARNIRDSLTELDPLNSQDYTRKAEAFSAELDRLDRDIRSMLQDLPNRRFMVFHPSWGYFADSYGLTQVPIESEGKAPGARTLTALIERAKHEHVKIIFVQPQFDKKSASRVAHAIGGHVVAIDPLSPDYADNLRKVAQRIAAAAQR